MQRFFFDDEKITDNKFTVTGDKHNHIVKVLRMSVGEYAVFCDGQGIDFECQLLSCDKQIAIFEVIKSYPNQTEPQIKITVFQCLPKGEKMDEMVKRSVQFGVYSIVPVLSKRCVSRPDSKTMQKKVDRLNKIALSSAMQSMRGIIPRVESAVDYKTALSMLKDYDNSYICYEDEKGFAINDADLGGKTLAIVVGPEGGIDESEIELAKEFGVKSISLGRRILRTEDAAPFAIPIILSRTNNL